MPAPSSRVRRDLQGLRTIAVLAVVATHLTGWPRGGFVGVDVFFVLSGFLVTGILLADLEREGTVRLGSFFARRVKRLLPAALVVLAATVGAAYVVFSPVRAESTLFDAVSAAGLVSNWHFGLEGRDYFAAVDVSPLQHFWSLSVEEQFSLVWPLIVLLAVAALPVAVRRARGGRVAVGLLAGAVVVASGIVAVVQTPLDPSLSYFSTLTRAGELATGAMIAAAAPVLARIPAAARGVLGWIGLAVIVAAFFLIDPADPFPAPGAALPVLGAALVIGGGIGGDPRHRHLFVLTNPLAVVIGDLSYSLYLWHLPVIVFAGVLLAPGPAATGITVLTMFVLTVATYLGIEQPLHRSPWAARRAVDHQEPLPIDAEQVPDPVPRRASVLASRPAGYVPGQRYYPGSRAAAPVPAHPAAPATVAEHRAERMPAPPASVVTPAAPAWAAWRSRYAPRVAMAGATLAIGAGATALAVMLAYGAPTLPGLPVAAPAAVDVAAEAGDALGVLQGELAAATTATSWPDLHPSLDEVQRDSSSANRARDCFTPNVALDAERCTWGAADAPRHLYLVGDSSAMAYAPAFAKLADDSGGAWRVTTVGMYGCRFTDVLLESRDPSVMAACGQRKADVAALIAASPADLLVVSNAFTLGRSIDGHDLGAGELASAIASEISGWAPAGRTVYLAPPPHGVDLGRCVSPLTGPSACLAGLDDVWTQMEAATEAQAAATGDTAISSLPFSCWQGACPAFAGDTPVRYDDTHITPAFAERLTPILRGELAARGLY
ncbi:peptidoglycan/LPS O-acetylase OafA/YrhL [Microbacterium sp. 1154]|uniref:acyltransferase family protein n=1 Tax=Microbacterium sp. 1154 TaxID=2817733 RepID=UPI002863E636|nr:acyltransferase family protein [Microbacterium sp. 1154]MDR6691991.1 peptidoglycan/LPS O-acetylase OafA/YrhL [Microbacterium sp. 1154]